MNLLVAYFLAVLLVPLTAWGVTLALAIVSGRLTRWHDEAGRTTGIDIRVASPLLEFLVGTCRGLAATIAVIALFSITRATPVLLGVEIVIALLSAWHIWVLRTHRRMWPIAAAAAIRSQPLDEARAKEMHERALKVGDSIDFRIRARWTGDVFGAALGGLLYLTLR